jgi:hypothetical protein
MRIFLTEEALVADYWRKLTRCIGAPYKSRGRVGRDAALRRPVGAARRPYRLGRRTQLHSYS